MHSLTYIIQCAKQRDYNSLSDYLAKHSLSVNMEFFHSGRFKTPVVELAKQGHIDKAIWLYQQFDARLSDIVRGVLANGDHNKLMRLYHQYNISIDVIVSEIAKHDQLHDWALELHEHYGASINQIAKAAAFNGQKDWAMRLNQQYGAAIEAIAMSAAQSNYQNWALELHQQYGDLMVSIARGAGASKDLSFARDLVVHHKADINVIARAFVEINNADTDELVLQKLLTTTDSAFRQQLIKALKDTPQTAIHNTQMIPLQVKSQLDNIEQKVQAVHAFQTRYQLDREQALLRQSHPQIMTWMLQCFALLTLGQYINKQTVSSNEEKFVQGRILPAELFYHITLFLAPADTTADQIQTMLFRLQQQFLLDNLQRYSHHSTEGMTLTSRFWPLPTEPEPHQQRAESLTGAIRQSQNRQQMSRLVQQQRRLFIGLDQTDAYGETLLTVATQRQNIAQVKRLLQRGAHPDVPNTRDKRTPLMIATLNNDEQLVDLLLSYQARTDLKDAQDNNVHHLAMYTDVDEAIIDKLQTVNPPASVSAHNRPLTDETRDEYYHILERFNKRLGCDDDKQTTEDDTKPDEPSMHHP